MRKILTKKNIITLVLTIALYAVLFGLVEGGVLSRHMKSLLVPIGINIILAVSLNLTVGFLGELTLGHAGFMSVGAYVGCIFSATSGLPDYLSFVLGMILGGLAAAGVGLIIGIPVLRLKGDYLAIVTLAFGEIIRSIMENLTVTGGASGYRGIPMLSNYTIVFIIVVITIFIIANLVNSRHGRAILSIRENEIAAESCGIHTTYYKVMAFTLSAFFAGVAGALYATYVGILQPNTFGFMKSIEILVMVVLGGMGSMLGSILSATVLTALPQVLLAFDKWRMVLYSIVLILVMIFKPSGLMGTYDFSMSRLLEKFMNRFGGKKKGEAVKQ